MLQRVEIQIPTKTVGDDRLYQFLLIQWRWLEETKKNFAVCVYVRENVCDNGIPPVRTGQDWADEKSVFFFLAPRLCWSVNYLHVLRTLSSLLWTNLSFSSGRWSKHFVDGFPCAYRRGVCSWSSRAFIVREEQKLFTLLGSVNGIFDTLNFHLLFSQPGFSPRMWWLSHETRLENCRSYAQAAGERRWRIKAYQRYQLTLRKSARDSTAHAITASSNKKKKVQGSVALVNVNAHAREVLQCTWVLWRIWLLSLFISWGLQNVDAFSLRMYFEVFREPWRSVQNAQSNLLQSRLVVKCEDKQNSVCVYWRKIGV